MSSAHILVTGGIGFIGSNLCEQLLKSGNYVIALDNLCTAYPANLQKFKNKQNFMFIEGDTRSYDFSSIPHIDNVTQIYDLASPASVTYFTEHPIEAAMTNSLGTYRLLELATKNNAKVLFTSTSEIYGDPLMHPQKESYWGNVNSIGIRSGYDEGKRFGESLCMAFYRERGTKSKIVRIFNTYGPASHPEDSRVVPSFITNALKNKDLVIHGQGEQTRSFCYVSDMVAGLEAMMNSDEIGPINLGNPQENTITEIAQKILSMTQSKSKLVLGKALEDDPVKRKPDIEKAKRLLNWEPRVDLTDGLEKTIEYFRTII